MKDQRGGNRWGTGGRILEMEMGTVYFSLLLLDELQQPSRKGIK